MGLFIMEPLRKTNIIVDNNQEINDPEKMTVIKRLIAIEAEPFNRIPKLFVNIIPLSKSPIVKTVRGNINDNRNMLKYNTKTTQYLTNMIFNSE